nr:GNAT family N-acetyltransferase [Sporolactobacillus mangiferae]
MAVHDECIDISQLPGLLAFANNKLSGILMYREAEDRLEIVSLDSFNENHGIGSALIKTIIKMAEDRKMTRLCVTTTNDNTHALHFYQRNGFTITAIRLDAVSGARKIKPAIPLKSQDGIVIEHEIDLNYPLA